jgi:endonuclease-8
MPEGDTVFRTCARLHEALGGRVLLAADLRWPGLSTAALAGATVAGVAPRGKHILLRLDTGWTLHSHLKMEGQWRVERTASPPVAVHRADARAVLVTPEWTAIGLRLGRLDLVRTSAEHTIVGHLGPDLLHPAFDLDEAVANLASDSAPIGAALLDQRNLAGIGTLWASESLFLDRLGPWTRDVPATRLARLVERARHLMAAAAASGRQTSTGSTRPGETAYVHARSGRPCRRCGSTVRVAPIGPPTRQRAMFYCPGCQGGLAPGDDGRPVSPLGAPAVDRGRRLR